MASNTVHTETIHGSEVDVRQTILPAARPFYVWIDGTCMVQRRRARARMFASIEAATDAAQRFINQRFGK